MLQDDDFFEVRKYVFLIYAFKTEHCFYLRRKRRIIYILKRLSHLRIVLMFGSIVATLFLS